MYSWSPNLSQISLKNSFGKVVFQILAEIEMTRNENQLFGRHFEMVQIFYIFFPEIWFWLVYIHMCKDNLKIPVGKWFSLGGVPWNPPLCTNGSAGYLMQLSVNIRQYTHTVIVPIWDIPYCRRSSIKTSNSYKLKAWALQDIFVCLCVFVCLFVCLSGCLFVCLFALFFVLFYFLFVSFLC